jgi:uncharacterized protein (TIGR01244 family)
MKRVFMAAILGVFAFSTIGFAQDLSIRNFLRVNTEFCTAGQPTVEELSDLKADGIRAVLNLRVPTEHDAAGEAAAVRELGMNYFNIPVDGANIGDGQVEEFLSLTDDESNQPMFIHCGSANRVGAFWMIRRAIRDGWSVSDAEAEADEIGLTSAALKDFALQYIETHRAP